MRALALDPDDHETLVVTPLSNKPDCVRDRCASYTPLEATFNHVAFCASPGLMILLGMRDGCTEREVESAFFKAATP